MNMETQNVSEFPDFFFALHGYPPMPWQVRLAERACEGQWPELIDLPTGAGKTSCLDIAVFALACQADRPPKERTAPLRTFLVVDRRIVVDDAFRRACTIERKLADAVESDGVLGRVARRLLALQEPVENRSSDRPVNDGERDGNSAGQLRPIAAVQLRGGIYRDVSWARSPTQPMLVTSTVDQVGSRLLFRGYGVSEAARPIHAALTACDSLIILDEAHVSKAFGQTLAAVRAYQKMPKSLHRNPSSPALLPCEGRREKDCGIASNAAKAMARPLLAIEMTATPSREVAAAARFGLTGEELADSTTVLGRRRFTSKPVELRVAEKATGRKAQMALAAELAELAPTLVSDQRRAVAIVVNRVATAKAVYQALLEKVGKQGGDAEQVELMIGRMRPLDRDAQAERLRKVIASDTPADQRPQQPLFVVATQCIEVGADLDFDAMISEAAPLDALRQRFGRLNRTGRQIEACGMIVIQAAQAKSDDELDELEKEKTLDDPVYGNSLARTWNRLSDLARDEGGQRVVDLGIAAADEWVGRIDRDQFRTQLVTGSPDAPILFPAHLDLLCQTSPGPAHDPDVSLWLHGPRRSSAGRDHLLPRYAAEAI